MKIAPIIWSSGLIIAAIQGAIGQSDSQSISEVEAATIVKEQEDARAARMALLRSNIESATVVEEFLRQKGPQQVALRRVHRPSFSSSIQKTVDKTHLEYGEDGEEAVLSPGTAEDYRREMISFSTHSYDDLYAEVTWRAQGSSESYTLWTNISLKFLPVLHSFESGGVRYDYFGFFYEISKETEMNRAQTLSFHGHEYESRWKEPPVKLSTTEPEYVVVAEDPAAVPEELFEQMDALLGYYLENQSNLRVAHENMKKLSKARAAYREANPPDPTEESVTIFWPIKNSRYLKEAK